MAMSGPSNENSLWMGDIEPFMDEQYILNAYKALGEEAVRVKFVKDKKTGARAFFCFVIFRDKAQASKVLQILNGKPFPQNPAKRFKLNFAQYGKDFSSPEFFLYIGELSPEVTSQVLQRFFAQRFPSAKLARVVVDQQGKSRGYGFVRFYNEHEQSMAQAQMNGVKGLGTKPIRVSKATPKIARQIDRAFQNFSNTVHIPTTGNVQSSMRPNHPINYESEYKFPGFYTHWNNYNHCYYSLTTAPLNPDTKNDDDILEDPTLTVDVDRMNMEFIDKSEEFYLAIEDSRWFAIDSNTTTYDDLCKK